MNSLWSSGHILLLSPNVASVNTKPLVSIPTSSSETLARTRSYIGRLLQSQPSRQLNTVRHGYVLRSKCSRDYDRTSQSLAHHPEIHPKAYSINTSKPTGPQHTVTNAGFPWPNGYQVSRTKQQKTTPLEWFTTVSSINSVPFFEIFTKILVLVVCFPFSLQREITPNAF